MKLSEDGKMRCFGGDPGKAFYADYHDNEWGIPKHDDQFLYEMLILEGAQAGLSWETILRKREGYREAFHGFDPVKVAAMTDEDLQERLQNPAIVRNKLKVFAARKNAIAFLKIQEEFGSFDAYLWAYVDGEQQINHWEKFEDVPASTDISEALSKDLKKRGMTFVGPTIMYAYMQSVGLVNDHLLGCCKRTES
ncbi:DNA-3-methyladenine glycosylase I [Leucothrix pacifica]|uniref:DNA-3-methyladenine glycosylase I n=1 Tax=Leucothrix pacifica TaxID=1247513 RepID=A0A317C5D2_9GAMM|nr:DNA-3-methyladenine glycosylase I [Leucothrix pacifica]PWQ92573.1 DNA-3-methyladenine glycosylase I [Leucothrix pacifica]